MPDGGFDEVVASQPSAFTTAGEVLRDAPLADWKAWLTFHHLRASAPYLSSAFVDANFAFYGRLLSGIPELRERWKRGVAVVEGSLGFALGKLYVERHFPPEHKAKMDRLVDWLVAAYRVDIERLEWMSAETREKALTKLGKFRSKVGYPEVWRDYSALEIDRNDLLGSVRRADAFEHDRQLAKLGQPIDRDEWLMTPQTVNAYYHPGMNEIVFPASILRPPFFDPEADDAVNFGGIGAVIGHEIGHGFDDQGSRFDGDGNLVDWWTDDDRANFDVKTKALVDQYDGFEPAALPGQHVNGALTVGENIGDLGGITIAHKAYELSLDGAEAPSSTASPAPSGCSSAGPRCGAPRCATRRPSASSPSIRTRRRSSAPTSCATWTSSSRRSTSPPTTACGSTRTPASASGSGRGRAPQAGVTILVDLASHDVAKAMTATTSVHMNRCQCSRLDRPATTMATTMITPQAR